MHRTKTELIQKILPGFKVELKHALLLLNLYKRNPICWHLGCPTSLYVRSIQFQLVARWLAQLRAWCGSAPTGIFISKWNFLWQLQLHSDNSLRCCFLLCFHILLCKFYQWKKSVDVLSKPPSVRNVLAVWRWWTAAKTSTDPEKKTDLALMSLQTTTKDHQIGEALSCTTTSEDDVRCLLRGHAADVLMIYRSRRLIAMAAWSIKANQKLWIVQKILLSAPSPRSIAAHHRLIRKSCVTVDWPGRNPACLLSQISDCSCKYFKICS